MSLFEARWAISFTFSLLAFSLPTNGFLTGLLNSSISASPSASKVAVSGSPFSNANVTIPGLATELSEASVAEVHETACPSIVAAIASAVSTVICTSLATDQFSIPGFTYAPCSTYTSYSFPKSVYPPASCCGGCSIQASRVQVNYWAPEANSTSQAPKTPYTLVSNGYTFTSPSVYVVYQDLYAQGDCTYYEQGQIGNNISDATVAYDPGALSTAPCVQSDETEFIGYEPINYLDWYNHVPNSVVETQPGCDIPNTSFFGINPAGTDLAANPRFGLPEGLSSLEPIWSSYGCQPNGRYPAFDPPRVLTKTSVLAPGIQQPAIQSATATPAAQLKPPIVTPTNVNDAQPTLKAGTPDPKSVDADPKAGGLIPGSATSDQLPTPTSQDAGPPENDPGAIAVGANLPTARTSASAEVAGHPDPANQGQGPGSSQNTGKDPPNGPPVPIVGPEPSSNPRFTVGNEVVTANSASQYVINGQTLTPGAPAVIISGTPISLGPSAKNVVIGANTIPLVELEPSALPSFTIGNEVITANSASQYVVNGQTLTPGAPAIIISGTPISLAPAAQNIVIGTSTIPLETLQPSLLPPFTIGNKVITADTLSHYIISGQTLTPGAPAITVSGTPISLAPSSAYIVIGSTTIPLQGPTTLPSAAPTVLVNGHVITINSASRYVIAGQTLTPFLTIASQAYPYAVDPAGDIVIASQTLVPGGAPVTIEGERVEEAADGKDVVVGQGGGVTTEGLAGFIAGAFGKTTAVATGAVGVNGSFDGEAFTGEAGGKIGMDGFWLVVRMALLVVIVGEIG